MAGMTTTLIELLAAAHRAGLVLAHRPDGQLVIRGPRSHEPLVRSLLARKPEVLTALAVYNGDAPKLDWRKGRILDQAQPCVLCGKRTLLIEPYDDRPCHKSCAEAAIRWGSVYGERAGGGHAA
jgi:hypothetical protein